MMGKKMALRLLASTGTVGGWSIPEQEEENTEEDGQNADAHGLGLLEDLDNAVQEGSDPEKPLEEGCQHEGADDGDIDNLHLSVLGR
jgi:hypothetical protein